MTNKFDIKQKQKLDSPRRREALPPRDTLLRLNLSEGDTFADIGCGIGYFTLPAAQIVGTRGKVIALDISEEMLEEAEKSAKEQGFTNIQFMKSKEYSLPLSDSSISYCFSCNVLHEVDDLTRIVKELKRILTNEGQLVIIEWNCNIADWGPPAAHRLDSAHLIELLKAEGLLPSTPIDIAGYFYALAIRKDNINETKAD